MTSDGYETFISYFIFYNLFGFKHYVKITPLRKSKMTQGGQKRRNTFHNMDKTDYFYIKLLIFIVNQRITYRILKLIASF